MQLLKAVAVVTFSCLSFVIDACAVPPGNVIFIHPDGTGLGHWNAARYFYEGPDGMLNWDELDRLAAYRPHQKNWLSTTSHAGATTHAYGLKVHHDSFGLDRTDSITALSGESLTIMEEAMKQGIRVGTINSGHIGEPGTAVFLASNESRKNFNEIALQVIKSGANLIFCGGEIHLIPEGQIGRHGVAGTRKDGRDLLKEAEEEGYKVIFTRDELLSLDTKLERVIGIFAATDTYNDENEEFLANAGLETYDPEAPTLDEMLKVGLKILGNNKKKRFFLVAEEEGTDNFSNMINARGMLDAMGRADKAIGEARDYMIKNPERDILLLVAADSDAGHPGIWGPKDPESGYRLSPTTSTGAQLDGPMGQTGKPFWSKPDAFGNRHPFGIAWGMSEDMPGSVVTKADGYRAELLGSSVDNTDLYRIMYKVLFGINN